MGGPSERNMFSEMAIPDYVTGSLSNREGFQRVTLLDRSYDYVATHSSNKNLYEDLLLLLDGHTLYYGRLIEKCAYAIQIHDILFQGTNSDKVFCLTYEKD